MPLPRRSDSAKSRLCSPREIRCPEEHRLFVQLAFTEPQSFCTGRGSTKRIRLQRERISEGVTYLSEN
jgi:hypothetical protein